MSDELTITGEVSMETMWSPTYTTQVFVGETTGGTIMESPMYQMEIGEGVILYVGGQTQPQELQTFEEIPFLHVSEGQIQEEQETEGQIQETVVVTSGELEEFGRVVEEARRATVVVGSEEGEYIITREEYERWREQAVGPLLIEMFESYRGRYHQIIPQEVRGPIAQLLQRIRMEGPINIGRQTYTMRIYIRPWSELPENLRTQEGLRGYAKIEREERGDRITAKLFFHPEVFEWGVRWRGFESRAEAMRLVFHELLEIYYRVQGEEDPHQRISPLERQFRETLEQILQYSR
jgi:PHD/YefM family antitoxin component YafN of YafNO toxin-antitoxin module